jgi:L-asparaginase II
MIRLSNGVRLVEVERSGVVESVHTGHVIVLDSTGAVRFEAGDPRQPVFSRSSLKPLQAVGMLRAGVRLSTIEIALAAASHSGSPQHLELIESELLNAGLTDADLECPPALPLGVAEQREYLAAGGSERRLAMNCSGKHAGMLLTCLANDWPVSGYLSPSHPLQRHLAETLQELTGERIAATAVDGCGAPLFAFSLAGLARGFARIATGTGAEQLVAEAMRSYPELVAGELRSATTLMRRVSGLIAKDGAEGGYAAALPDGGAVAVKIDDGATRAADCAVAWALHHLGVDQRVVSELAITPVLGGGEPVGRVRPAPGW